MKSRFLTVLAASGLLLAAGCAGDKAPKASSAPQTQVQAAQAPQPSSAPPPAATGSGNGGERNPSGLMTRPLYTSQVPTEKTKGIIEMEKGGRMVFTFYPKEAPIHVSNFIHLAEKGFYDGVVFHRVVPGFVIQGGDPQGTGMGGPGWTIKEEFTGNPHKHLLGTLSMARTPNPNSGGSQFYFCLAPLPQLDGQYTVFGQIIEGLDVMKGVQKGDKMKKVSIEY